MSDSTAPEVWGTIFTPADPVAAASMRNCAGLTAGSVLQEFPAMIIAGQFQIRVPESFGHQDISIEARAYNAAGDTRAVTVVPTVLTVGVDESIYDIFIRDDLGALTNDALNVEVTAYRLPLV